MAATRALFCVDILDIVLDYLSPGPTPHGGECHSRTSEPRRLQRSLARMARVCGAVSESALDVLWMVVDDMMHILSVLPLRRGHSEAGDIQASSLLAHYSVPSNKSCRADLSPGIHGAPETPLPEVRIPRTGAAHGRCSAFADALGCSFIMVSRWPPLPATYAPGAILCLHCRPS